MKKMKRFLAVVMIVMCCLSPSVVLASSSEIVPYGLTLPTQAWYLYNNNYNYEAYVNRYCLYSNYYFVPETPGRFHFFGNEMFNVAAAYYACVHNRSTGAVYRRYVSANEHGFNYASYNVSFDAGSQFYFSIDGSGTGAEISLSGQMNTY